MKMVETGLKECFEKDKVKILCGKNITAEVEKYGKLYSVKYYRDRSEIRFGGRIEKQELWYRRYLNSVKNGCDTLVCEACVLGKQTREPFVKR